MPLALERDERSLDPQLAGSGAGLASSAMARLLAIDAGALPERPRRLLPSGAHADAATRMIASAPQAAPLRTQSAGGLKVQDRPEEQEQVVFFELNDGSCFGNIQVVCGAELEGFDEIAHLTTGSAVEVVGELVESPAKGQRVELKATKVEIVGRPIPSYPLQKKRHSFEFLRTIAHLRPRTNTFGAVFRTRSALAQAIHAFFQERGFVEVNTPIITASDCEGAGEMFRVSTLDMANLPRTPAGDVDYAQDFFGSEAFLTVSGQLSVETYCCALTKVYTFGPTFRAENSNTSRHLAEFWMIEPEMAFCDLDDDMRPRRGASSSTICRPCSTTAPRTWPSSTSWIDKGLSDRLEARGRARASSG